MMCEKNIYDHMCNNTLAHTGHATDNICVNSAFSSWNKFEGGRIPIKGSYNKQNLTFMVIS